MPKTVAELRKLAEQCQQRAESASHAAAHASDYAPGSYVTGGSGRTRAQNRATERALDRTINMASRAVYWREKAKQYAAEADWLENAPQREARAAKQAVIERDITAWKRSQISAGGKVELLCNGALLTVKRVNDKSITDSHNERWAYADIMPLRADGTRYTTEQAVAAFKAWRSDV